MSKVGGMKTNLTLLFFVAGAFAMALSHFSFAADEEEAKAREALAGKWKGGVEDGATGHELTFSAEAVSGARDGKQNLGAGTFTIDQSTTPWSLDAVRTEGGKKGQLNLGIYSLRGNTLKWCVDPSGKDRPTKFATGDGNFLLVLRRVRE